MLRNDRMSRIYRISFGSSSGSSRLQTEQIESPLKDLTDPTANELLRLAGLTRSPGEGGVSTFTRTPTVETPSTVLETPSTVLDAFNLDAFPRIEAPTLAPFDSATASRFAQPFDEQLLRGSFGPRTTAEEALVKSIINLTGGQSGKRGLGVPTPGGIAQNIAPTLVALNQQQTENLQNALFGDLQAILTGRGQTSEFNRDIFGKEIGQRGTDIEATLRDITRRQGATDEQARRRQAEETQKAEILASLLGVSLPQIVAGTEGDTSSFSFGVNPGG